MEERDPKKYEIGYLVKNEGEESAVLNLLRNYKAQIIEEGKARKIRLAYPIKKETFAQFGFVHFLMAPELVKEFSSQLRLNAQVLRFIVITLPSEAKMKASEVKFEKAPLRPRVKSAEPMKKQPPSDMIDNEMLEKKLEEILK